MARIKPSALISDIRGSVQGSTFQQSQGGLVLKSKSIKVGRDTIAQSRVKSIQAYVRTQWEQFSDSERDVWRSFANFSRVLQKNSSELTVNAQSLFSKVNVIRLLYGYSLLTTPAFSFCVSLAVSFSIDLSGGNLILTTSRLVNSAVEFVVCFATNRRTAATNNPGSAFRLLVFASSTSTTFDITAAYAGVFGAAPESNDLIFVRCYVANLESGLFTQPQIIRQTLS